MLKNILFLLAILCFSALQAQESNSLYKIKKIPFTRDTIHLENESLNPSYFKLLDANDKPIDSTNYKIDFEKGTLLLNKKIPSSTGFVAVQYLKLPSFLTKEYKIYDSSKVISNQPSSGELYAVESNYQKKTKPLEGLNTSGSITRGVTIGNNQNSVLNSNLDLQITGKLSDKVSLRASLQDSNIPLQDGGYSQKLDQFDNVFMELFSDNWNIRAGDLFLENRSTQFLNFNKKAQGLSSTFNFGNEDSKTSIFASAALVRGQYSKSSFVGQEGNQGPYKLIGQNGELFVLVISGSERVFVNGILLTRGENKDYTIDYNAGEIIFTPLFTITSEMRITVEYQYTEQNYTRLMTYAGGTHESKKWSFGGYLYSENDLKNQPLQQSLSAEQIQILKDAGDNKELMMAPSAYLDSYSDNKILYKKTIANGVEYFEYSNNPQDVLYNVRFSQVEQNKGNYVVKSNAAIGRIYEYVAPINTIPQGNYAALIQLVAPIKIQAATFLGKYNPSEKTTVDFEFGLSTNDKNLFSAIDDSNNKGVATKINAKQRLFSKKWNVDAFANYQFVQKDFSTIERLYNIEFGRDWNLGITTVGNQSYLISGLLMALPEKGNLTYQFEKLDFTESFAGSRHILNAFFNLKDWTIKSRGSFLNSDSSTSTSSFLRNQTQVKYNLKKNWIGTTLNLEDNQEKEKNTNQFSALSQRFSEYGFFAGRGDSTKVFVEMGYFRRINDSLQNGLIQRVNNSQTIALKSKLIQTNKSDLSLFVNYRVLDFVDANTKNEPSLNSRMVYNDRFFNQMVQWTTVFETNSGSIPQQEYTYLEVPIGQGVYTWNDYNNNGIQELEEFEVAPFVDQAKYIRIFLPNRIFIKTHQNKFSQSITLNPNQWQNKRGFKKLLSYFYNQTSYLIDRKVENNGDNFDLNPFSKSDENVLGLTSSIRNSLFFNRGKQKHSVTYTYVQNENQNLLSNGSQNAKNSSNQLQYNHLYQKSWLIGMFAKTIGTELDSENYPEKNFKIKGYQLAPKISYLFSKSTSWDLFYELQNKENQIGILETLVQNRLGTAFTYAGKKNFTMNGEVSFYQNKFEGNEFSSVGFQMLEGLQTGQNLTWRLLLQKNLTSFLDINFNYQGRKSETSQAIHTGSVQMRAYF
jgi:hypothetical protein